MSDYRIKESTSSILPLTAEQADELREIGRELASSSPEWRHQELDEADSDTPPKERTVISVTDRGVAGYEVCPRGVIGVVGITTAQIHIDPKISTRHFLHLMARARPELRQQRHRVAVADDASFRDVVFGWYVSEVQELLRHDLIRDYSEREDELRAVRGSVMVAPTTRKLLTGRLRVDCRFDEFNQNTPLNRVLLSALQVVVGNPHVDTRVRQSARRALARFGGVGARKPQDLRISKGPLERRAHHYAPALTLASLIITNGTVAATQGRVQGRSFVIPSAALVEEGIRNILRSALPVKVRKEQRSADFLFPSVGKLDFKPDLVFGGGSVVGDVKYRIARSADWSSNERNQLLAFAAAFDSHRAVVVGFAEDPAHSPPAVSVGTSSPVELYAVNWQCAEDVEPAQAELLVIETVAEMLASWPPPKAPEESLSS